MKVRFGILHRVAGQFALDTLQVEILYDVARVVLSPQNRFGGSKEKVIDLDEHRVECSLPAVIVFVSFRFRHVLLCKGKRPQRGISPLRVSRRLDRHAGYRVAPIRVAQPAKSADLKSVVRT